MADTAGKATPALDGRVVFVTGANGGLGQEFVRQALGRGARRVYAAARSPRGWDDARVRPIALDVTVADAVDRATAEARDVDLLVNNAAIAPQDDAISGPEAQLRRVFETNFFGALRVANAFAPVLGANGGGALVNVLSAAAWTSMPTSYAASKAALWSATNALRFALEGQGTQVVAVLVGMVDTPMSARFPVPKTSPSDVVAQIYDGIAAGAIEILADDLTRDLKSRLGTQAEQFYPWMHAQLHALLTP